jgi:hypothetical protein
VGVNDVNHERLMRMTVAEGVELVSGLRFGEPLPTDEAAAYLRQFDDIDPAAPWLVEPQLPPEQRAA